MGARLRISGREYEFFNQLTIDLKYEFSASTFSFGAEFDPDNPTHRRIFRPLTYPTVAVTSDLNERLISGVVLTHKFTRDARRQIGTLSGYSLTGVLSDCEIPIDAYPLHFTNVTLRELAARLLSFFNLGVRVVNDGGIADEIIPEITAKTSSKVYGFLSEIAAQRNLVITHDSFDNLVITRPNVSVAPVATFRQGVLPATSMNLTVNGQNIYSSITALKQSDIQNDNVSETTINNPLVNIFRPMVKQFNVGNDVTAEEAAANLRANQLSNVRLVINTDRWEWLRNGQPETMRPDNIVSVVSPDNYIFRPTNFFVESVKLNLDNNKETATLSCVPPQVYNNQVPTQLFT